MLKRLGLALVMGLVASSAGVPPVAAVPPAHPPAHLAAHLEEHPCGAGSRARCGTVTVPLDRTQPAGHTLRIGYERYPRSDRTLPALETIVAIEGGPGYATTASRDYYLDLFRPLMDRHDLLLVDLRGTGTSEPIDCQPLQSLRLPEYDRWVKAVGRCGRQLGDASDLYGTANAADDLADVLDALGIDVIDLYGDSYGTFFAQTFAVRHPNRLRSLVLDAAYPVEGADPWWRDLTRAAVGGLQLVCERDPGCASVGGDPIHRLARLNRRIARHPIIGIAPDADGKLHRVTIDPGILIYVFWSAGYSPTVYRELDAAVRAALRPHPDVMPLLRLARENVYLGGGGAPKFYSQGLAEAVECNDYPQLYDMLAPPRDRSDEYRAAIRRLERLNPRTFWPFTIRQWVTSPVEDFDSCLRWPVPDRPLPPLPEVHTYPDVPTLVLVGDLDSVTSPEGAARVASSFPNATLVTVSNMTHVSALGDRRRCASRIVLRFVRTLSAGDTSCAADYPEIRAVDEFARRADAIGVGSRARRTALVVANTVADVIARWSGMGGSSGVGLRGGTFTTSGYVSVQWSLSRVRWVRDIAVSGTASWDRRTGAIRADVTFTGTGAPAGRLRLAWNDFDSLAQASVRGRLNGHRVSLVIPAP
ncbi:MAG: alpha/beta fold hydrolase [Actinomycetota bacterium]